MIMAWVGPKGYRSMAAAGPPPDLSVQGLAAQVVYLPRHSAASNQMAAPTHRVYLLVGLRPAQESAG